MQTLLRAHQQKRISVYVTEARPRSLGNKTYEALTAAGIPCAVVLDSAVAYVMEKVDVVLVGSEAIVESGGLINAVGSNQMAIIAKAANKPFYAVAERWARERIGGSRLAKRPLNSYKFHRLFPLSQYDLPSHKPDILSFTNPLFNSKPLVADAEHEDGVTPSDISNADTHKARSVLLSISQEDIYRNNPDVDYTRPDLISLVFSDVGSLTPEGVSQYLVGMFAGPQDRLPSGLVVHNKVSVRRKSQISPNYQMAGDLGKRFYPDPYPSGNQSYPPRGISSSSTLEQTNDGSIHYCGIKVLHGRIGHRDRHTCFGDTMHNTLSLYRCKQ
ncbi:translation initiation factor eIF-2B [Salix suchowensis]|nr:translation initiation factor eIF-2B [Salix suchowensis]